MECSFYVIFYNGNEKLHKQYIHTLTKSIPSRGVSERILYGIFHNGNLYKKPSTKC